MNAWAWILVVYLTMNAVYVVTLVGKPKKQLRYTSADALAVLALAVLAWLAVAS